MSMSDFFARLGAPLANTRWSWGARRPGDGAVFLRVWQDLKRFEHGEQYMLVDGGHRESQGPRNPGYRERLGHLDAVRQGASCYLVMCIAKDTAARPRTILDFHHEEVFVGGELVDREGGFWVRLAGRKPVADVRSLQESDAPR